MKKVISAWCILFNRVFANGCSPSTTCLLKANSCTLESATYTGALQSI